MLWLSVRHSAYTAAVADESILKGRGFLSREFAIVILVFFIVDKNFMQSGTDHYYGTYPWNYTIHIYIYFFWYFYSNRVKLN